MHGRNQKREEESGSCSGEDVALGIGEMEDDGEESSP